MNADLESFFRVFEMLPYFFIVFEQWFELCGIAADDGEDYGQSETSGSYHRLWCTAYGDPNGELAVFWFGKYFLVV